MALGLLLAGTAIAQFGLIELIAKGYGTLTWVFLVVVILPLLTLGVWKLASTQPVTAER